MTYDKIGNILSDKRYGKLTPSSSGLIDNLNLSYSGKQLQKSYRSQTTLIKEIIAATSALAVRRNRFVTDLIPEKIAVAGILNLPRLPAIGQPVGITLDVYCFDKTHPDAFPSGRFANLFQKAILGRTCKNRGLCR